MSPPQTARDRYPPDAGTLYVIAGVVSTANDDYDAVVAATTATYQGQVQAANTAYAQDIESALAAPAPAKLGASTTTKFASSLGGDRNDDFTVYLVVGIRP